MRPSSDWLETLPKDQLMAKMSLRSAEFASLGAEISPIDAFTDIHHIDAEAENRLCEVRALVANRTAPGRILLCADGGIREHTVPKLARAGAKTVVIGSLAFEAENLAQCVARRHAQPMER